MPALLRSAAAAALVGSAVAACERSGRAPPADSAAPAPARPDTALPIAAPPAWDTSAGPALFVPGATPSDAQVVLPRYRGGELPDTLVLDGQPITGATIDMFSRAGQVGLARLGELTERRGKGAGGGSAADCLAWPRTPLKRAAEQALPLTWTVALLGGRARPLPLDSIEALPPADSALLAAEAARLASALPSDTAQAFRGIPFAVRAAYRFRAAPRVDALVADVIRKVNQEANPVEEHILIVAERDSGATERRYRTVYFERASGLEHEIESSEVLAALRLGSPSRAALVLRREGEDSRTYAFLERVGKARWRVRWTSTGQC